MARCGPHGEPDREGTLLYADFQLEGRWFAAMDSAQGHRFDFNEATSFIINCDDQAEVDYYWGRLSADAAVEQCGWLKDRFGVSWQVVPSVLYELMQHEDRERAHRNLVMHVTLPILDADLLMGTDAPESMGFRVEQGNNLYIMLEPDTRAETDQAGHAYCPRGGPPQRFRGNVRVGFRRHGFGVHRAGRAPSVRAMRTFSRAAAVVVATLEN